MILAAFHHNETLGDFVLYGASYPGGAWEYWALSWRWLLEWLHEEDYHGNEEEMS